MKSYVLGFAFNADHDYVVLIRKNKPEWQKGNLNGVGGKIEPEETPPAAMAREFKEETGLITDSTDWKEVGKMSGEGWECFVFTMTDDSLMEAKTMEDEEVSVFPVQEIIEGKYDMISNVPFLIELCRDNTRPKLSVFYY